MYWAVYRKVISHLDLEYDLTIWYRLPVQPPSSLQVATCDGHHHTEMPSPHANLAHAIRFHLTSTFLPRSPLSSCIDDHNTELHSAITPHVTSAIFIDSLSTSFPSLYFKVTSFLLVCAILCPFSFQIYFAFFCFRHCDTLPSIPYHMLCSRLRYSYM